jgi:orotidine-5'-phosphate decarboxylase
VKKEISINERIIFALDFADPDEALGWVKKLDSELKFFKVGLQLFLAGWFHVIDEIVKRGNKVMVDLKFFDIPETVKLAVEQLQNRKITFATVHGNDTIVKAAAEAKGDVQILAVTVLTSFGENDMREMGFTGSVEDLVMMRCRRALDLGCDGVVSSALEASRLRQEFGENFLVVTPGIRPGANIETSEDDQVRIATAKQAIINGADHVVVGRPIKNASDPLALIRSMHEEIAEGLALKK